MVNFTGPHNPLDVTAGMLAGWEGEGEGADFPPPVGNDQVDRATHGRIRRNYAAMLENIDRHIGRFLAVVAARGEMERTLVVYASDHGEMLGDHNLWGKSVPYQPSVGIPLVAAGPGVPRRDERRPGLAARSGAHVRRRRRAAPLPLAADGADGRSLWPLLRGAGPDGAHRDVVRSALRSANHDWRLAFDGRFKLVAAAGRPPALRPRGRSRGAARPGRGPPGRSRPPDARPQRPRR